MRRHFSNWLIFIVGLMFSTNVYAQEQTAEDVLKTEVLACTDRALNPHLYPLDGLDWTATCKERSENLCAGHLRTQDGLTDAEQIRMACYGYSQVAWKAAADQIKARLVQRWQGCAVPDSVRSDMIRRIEQTDAAVLAFYAANCGYDAAQWRAHDRPDIAAMRESRCLAEGETARTWLHYWNSIRDAGCETATPSP